MTKTKFSTLIKAVHAEELATVCLRGVDRNLLLRPINDEFLGRDSGKTSLAHQFGCMGQLHRIQPLLLPDDYDFQISVRSTMYEPPLYCFARTLESLKQLPVEVFTEDRLFSQYEADGAFMWIQTLVGRQLVDRIPTHCLGKEKLLKPYFPDHLDSTILASLIRTGQTQSVCPKTISAMDIINNENCSNIIASICQSEFRFSLDPNDFAPWYPALKMSWENNRRLATKASAKWFIEAANGRISYQRLKKGNSSLEGSV